MKTIIMLLALPVLIKIFVHFGFLKLSKVPRSIITAEMVIEDINRQKIRSAKVEIEYCYTQKLFHDALKNRKLTRDRIIAIRQYLNRSVHQYEHKKFENDAHAIYTMLKAKDITVRKLDVVQSLISTVDGRVNPNWINVAGILNK